ncbi:MAG: hypothetical protein V7K58_13965 [Nostoc sp.]
MIKLDYAIASIAVAIALRFLNPAGSCYTMTFYRKTFLMPLAPVMGSVKHFSFYEPTVTG